MIPAMMEESFSRNVLWACRNVPELEAIARKSSTKLAQMTSTADATTMTMLEKLFVSTAVSRQLYSFHCCFLRLVAHPHGANLEEMARNYDRTLGAPSKHMQRQMREMVGYVAGIRSWPQYFESVRVKCPTPQRLASIWVQSVQKSLANGYHSTTTNFKQIQQSGVSSILMRGKSYPRVVFCIDVSGSMCCTSVDQATGQWVSRLDYVKKDLQSIFASKLTHQQQFTLVSFDHRARMWSKGLQQATKANLDAAAHHVQGWEPEGGTDFEVALDAAFGVEGVQAVYLLSDGEHYGNTERLLDKVRRLSRGDEVRCHATAFHARGAS
jgi:hypothetical protein